jgi:hypothetical protein
MAASSAIEYRLGDIPQYLQEGQLFRSLAHDGDNTVCVDPGVVKANTTVTADNDLKQLLCSLKYWLVDSFPPEVFESILNGDYHPSSALADEFQSEFPLLPLLVHLSTLPTPERRTEAARNATDVKILDCIFRDADRTCSKWCETAVSTGNLPGLRYFHEAGFAWDSDLLEHCVCQEGVEYLQYVVEHGCEPAGDLTGLAIRCDRLEALVYLVDVCELELDEFSCDEAVRADSAKCLEYLRDECGCVWSSRTFLIAAGGGSVNCLPYLHGNSCPHHAQSLCTAAATSGQLDCLMFLHEHNYAWDERTILYAAKNGNLECLQFAHEHGCPRDASALRNAGQAGHLACVRYLHEQDYPWDAAAVRETCAEGHFDCLQYLHEHGCPWDATACTAAAEAGHLDCLQYLHEHGCPWECSACDLACFEGHLDCVRYLHEHGCPWGDNTCTTAAKGGHLPCVEYIVERGCRINEEEVRERSVPIPEPCRRFLIAQLDALKL